MAQKMINKSVLLVLTLLISGLFLSMISQFLMPVFLAGIFSALSRPLYRRLLRRFGGRSAAASLSTLLLIVFLVLIPLTLLATVVVGQAISVGQSVTPWVQRFINQPSELSGYLEKLPYYEQILPYRDDIVHKAGQLVSTVSSFLVGSLSSITKGTMNAIFSAFIMLYTMFFFLINGDRLLRQILYYLPLGDHDEQRLLQRFTSVTRATLKGTMIIGLLQGGVCGIGFILAGIPSPLFWATLMAVMSIVPAFGTAIVWVPATVILAVSGHWAGVVILLVICGAIAGNLDNLIRPRLVGKDTQMHDLYILFSTLGGIGMFGILGIIIGPIIAALFVTIWEIYGEVFQAYLPEVRFYHQPTVEDEEEDKTGKPQE